MLVSQRDNNGRRKIKNVNDARAEKKGKLFHFRIVGVLYFTKQK